jgi:uncharacterized caspase-like protein
MKNAIRTLATPLLVVAALGAATARAVDWPEVRGELPPQNLGANDAAVVIGISEYAFLPKISNASLNASDWFLYLVKTRGIPESRVKIVTDSEATDTGIREATKEAAALVGEGGTLFFIFVGHGAPNEAHDDGILIGVDAQATEKSLISRGVPQKEILEILEGGKQAHTVAIFDACFSGTAGDGKTPLVAGSQATVPVRRVASANTGRTVILSSSDQVAGPLPGHNRPAFSYLLLGSVRGWADRDKNAHVTTIEAFEYTRDVLRDLVRGRNQVPSIRGSSEPFDLSVGATEAGPDIVALRAAVAPSQFRGAQLNMPAIDPSSFQSSSLRGLNIAVEKALDAALKTQKAEGATATAMRDAWCNVAGIKENNQYLDKATEACTQLSAYVQAEEQLQSSISQDYDTLTEYLGLDFKNDEEKLAITRDFLSTYGRYKDRQEVKAARVAEGNLENHKPAGISKDTDNDHILVDACPSDPEDFDQDADDDGCPEKGIGEATSEAIDGAKNAAGKALDEAGIHFYLTSWDFPNLETGGGLGLGIYDESGVPTKLDRPLFRPNLGWVNRFSWGIFETGANVDWDLSRDLDDDALSLDVYGGARIIGISVWTPSVGVDFRNVFNWAQGRTGGAGVYFGNTFHVVSGLSIRLTYRYGLEPPGSLLPVHTVFLETLVSLASPAGSPVFDALKEMDLCD